MIMWVVMVWMHATNSWQATPLVSASLELCKADVAAARAGNVRKNGPDANVGVVFSCTAVVASK